MPTEQPETERLIRELQEHQIELELQNDELRRSLAELEVSRSRYFDLYDLAPVGYLEVPENGVIREANLTAATMLGLEREKLQNKPKLQFIFAEDRDIYYFHRKEVLESTEQKTVELRMVRADGSTFWAELQSIPTGNGEYRVIFTDISARKRSEEELYTTNNLLESIIEFFPNMIFIKDAENLRFIRFNKAGEELLGYSKDNILGRNDYDFFPKEQAELFIEQDRAVLSEKVVKDISEEAITTRNRGVRILYTRKIPILNADGNAEYLLGISDDITETKLAEAALQQAHEKLEQRVTERTAALNRSLEQVQKATFELAWAEERERERIAGELHDQVGQNLLLAKMKLDAVADMALPDPVHDHIAKALTLLESSIYDIRTLTFRMRPPVLETAGIESILEWLCSSVYSEYGLKTVFTSDNHPKPLTDEVRYSIYKAVKELLVNVAKHAGTSQATLALTTDGHVLSVCVNDEGSGFAYSEAALQDAEKKNFGLLNVQQRIVRMGGSFTVESAPGRGTVTTVTVPLS